MKNILWNLFLETGKIDIYLVYKEYQSSIPSTYSQDDLIVTYETKKCINGH
jgi:hypothetical protein